MGCTVLRCEGELSWVAGSLTRDSGSDPPFCGGVGLTLIVAFGWSTLGILAGTSIDPSAPTVCLGPGSIIGLGAGAGEELLESPDEIGRASADTAVKAIRGS